MTGLGVFETLLLWAMELLSTGGPVVVLWVAFNGGLIGLTAWSVSTLEGASELRMIYGQSDSRRTTSVGKLSHLK